MPKALQLVVQDCKISGDKSDLGYCCGRQIDVKDTNWTILAAELRVIQLLICNKMDFTPQGFLFTRPTYTNF